MWVGGRRHAPDIFTPGKDRLPIVYEVGWVRGPVWTGVEYLAPSGIRSSNPPARSESLHQLSYPGPTIYSVLLHNGHLHSPSHSRNDTHQIQLSWRGRESDPPKYQNTLFIKDNVRTRRDLDICCAFGCSRFKFQHRNRLSWLRCIRSCLLNLQGNTWIHTN